MQSYHVLTTILSIPTYVSEQHNSNSLHSPTNFLPWHYASRRIPYTCCNSNVSTHISTLLDADSDIAWTLYGRIKCNWFLILESFIEHQCSTKEIVDVPKLLKVLSFPPWKINLFLSVQIICRAAPLIISTILLFLNV